MIASHGGGPERGIDFAWGCANPSGWSFGASYLSYDASKNWTRPCLDRWHRHHATTVAVWETSAARATAGYGAGFSDAREASRQLAALGAPAGQPFDMAIDCDCSGQSVAAYFRGADAAEPGRVNAYGGYWPLLYLSQHHLVGHLNWQTYAWSGGRWLPARIAPLEQYLNGNSFDRDRAIAASYGQWPLPVTAVHHRKPKPAPKPHPAPRPRRAHHSARWRSLHYLVHRHCEHRTHRYARVCRTWRRELARAR